MAATREVVGDLAAVLGGDGRPRARRGPPCLTSSTTVRPTAGSRCWPSPTRPAASGRGALGRPPWRYRLAAATGDEDSLGVRLLADCRSRFRPRWASRGSPPPTLIETADRDGRGARGATSTASRSRARSSPGCSGPTASSPTSGGTPATTSAAIWRPDFQDAWSRYTRFRLGRHGPKVPICREKVDPEPGTETDAQWRVEKRRFAGIVPSVAGQNAKRGAGAACGRPLRRRASG